MDHLSSILNAADGRVVTESNMEILDRSLAFKLQPSIGLSGSPTTELGAPAAGDHVLDELWVDVLGAVWRCTVAGSPGTWIQIAPAVVNIADLPANPPDNYLCKCPDGPWLEKYWDGAAWVDL